MLMTMTMDLDTVKEKFYQHFFGRFQQHITPWVFGNWKKPSSQARVTFKPPTLEHLIFSQPAPPPPCPLSIKFSEIFFVRLLDMNQSRTTGGVSSNFGPDCRLQSQSNFLYRTRCCCTGPYQTRRNNGHWINLLLTHQFYKASTWSNSVSANHFCAGSSPAHHSPITYYSPLNSPPVTTFSCSYNSPHSTAHLA